jgi:hypothetical protein
MNWRQLWNIGKQLVTRGLQQIETKVKEWTKPAPDRQITGVATDLFRSKKELIAENAFLRQQLIVLKRQTRDVHRSRSRIGACWSCWPASCAVGRMRCIS